MEAGPGTVGTVRPANKRRMHKVLTRMDSSQHGVKELDSKVTSFHESIRKNTADLANVIEEMIKLKEAINTYVNEHSQPCGGFIAQLSKKRVSIEHRLNKKSNDTHKKFKDQLHDFELMINREITTIDKMDEILHMYVDMMSFSAWLERALIGCLEIVLSYVSWASGRIREGSAMDYVWVIGATLIIYHLLGWTVCSWTYCYAYHKASILDAIHSYMHDNSTTEEAQFNNTA